MAFQQSLHPAAPVQDLNEYEKQFVGSTIRDNTSDYPKFDISEFNLAKTPLGEGGFGVVYEIRSIRLSPRQGTRGGKGEPSSSLRSSTSATASLHEDSATSVANTDDSRQEEDKAGRTFLATHATRKAGENRAGDSRYALKMLRPEVLRDPKQCKAAQIDLATEARCLSHIDHPNIIKMRALAKGNARDPFRAGYFIVLDRLYDTLELRMKKWQKKCFQRGGLLGGKKKKPITNSAAAKAVHEERLVAAFDLSAALDYLHKHNIVYRDIKPENIGFDIRDDVRLFDFGLIKELRPYLRKWDGTYRLTPKTGTLRYMAPEVYNGDSYNTTADCYSFAILLWEMMALEPPFEQMSIQQHKAKVLNGPHERPPIDTANWPKSVQICIKRGWEKNPTKRASMEQICAMLRQECVRLRGGNAKGLEHAKRRSTHILRRVSLNFSNGGAGSSWLSRTGSSNGDSFANRIPQRNPPPPPAASAPLTAPPAPRAATQQQPKPQLVVEC